MIGAATDAPSGIGTARSARPNTHTRVYLLLMVMVLTWSFNFVIGKFALRELPADVVVSWRTPLSGLFILPLYLWRNRGVKRKWPPRDILTLLALGLFGVIGNQALFVLGLARTSVAHASIAVALTPLSVLLIASAIGQERLTTRKLAGMAIALGGVTLLQAGRTSGGNAPTPLGDLTVWISGVVFAAYAVLGKSVASRYGSLTANTFAYVGGGIAMLPATWHLLSKVDVSRVSTTAFLSVVYMAIFPAVVGYLIFYYALQHLPASRVSAFSYLQPVLATVLAFLLLGEHPGLGFVVGGALVLAGVFLTERG